MDEHLVPVASVNPLDFVYNNNLGRFVQVYVKVRNDDRVTFICDDGPAFSVDYYEKIVIKPHTVEV